MIFFGAALVLLHILYIVNSSLRFILIVEIIFS
jgi:hypothetical protein